MSKKHLRIAIQMDPIAHVNIAADSSFAMAIEAQARGYDLYVYTPDKLSWREGKVTAVAQPAQVRNEVGNHVSLGDAVVLDLAADVDVVLMRQDPPFDMAYLSAAHMLETLKGQTLVLNDPFWVRNSPEKILPLMFHDLMPPTLISRDRAAIADFRATHQDIVVKPLFGNAGAGVFRIKADDGNLGSLLDMFFATSREPVMVQAFLPSVFDGDKRIILVDGAPAGVLNRIPTGNDIRSNLAAGGTAAATNISAADKRICDAIGPTLKERGLMFVGIDVIAGHLTEINVTSPTGALPIKRLSGIDVISMMWDAILTKV